MENPNDKGPEFLQGQETGSTDQRTAEQRMEDAKRADEEAARKRNEAEEAARKLAEADKSKEQKRVDALNREADLKRLEADKARLEAGEANMARTVEQAGVVAPVSGDTPLHRPEALKRANDPANPQPLMAEHLDDDKRTVKIQMDTPDGKRFDFVHPDALGDYLRAGWAKAEETIASLIR